MGIVDDKIKDLKEREKKILKMGGEKAIAKEREKAMLFLVEAGAVAASAVAWALTVGTGVGSTPG